MGCFFVSGKPLGGREPGIMIVMADRVGGTLHDITFQAIDGGVASNRETSGRGRRGAEIGGVGGEASFAGRRNKLFAAMQRP